MNNTAQKHFANTEIVRAGSADAVVISSLAKQTFVESFAYVYEEKPDILKRYLENTFSEEKIAASLQKPHNHYYLAVVNGVPAAYMKFKENSSVECIDSKSQLQLQKLYVKKEFQNDGIGLALMDTCIQFVVARKPVVVWLGVLDRNEGAQRFYERYGFKTVGESFHDFEDIRVRFYVMSLAL